MGTDAKRQIQKKAIVNPQENVRQWAQLSASGYLVWLGLSRGDTVAYLGAAATIASAIYLLWQSKKPVQREQSTLRTKHTSDSSFSIDVGVSILLLGSACLIPAQQLEIGSVFGFVTWAFLAFSTLTPRVVGRTQIQVNISLLATWELLLFTGLFIAICIIPLSALILGAPAPTLAAHLAFICSATILVLVSQSWGGRRIKMHRVQIALLLTLIICAWVVFYHLSS